ncbi:hypothetical protein [Haloferula sp. A504]|uniref:hypothetical protein n=1 Tax=Haloferula sp. A504 TaxID=3373601 RepID=UPI0031C93705|nr:hypothetical protein [Verrucomicrobiaceae bacterium E54]
MSTKAIAIAAFVVGLPPLLVAPFAILYGGAYILEALGFHHDPLGVPFDWGLGGVLYCIGIPVWIGYIWAARSHRSGESLKIFWTISTGLNAIWAVFFIGTSNRPEQLSSPSAVWAVYAVFPAILLFVSVLGYLAAAHRQGSL